jgi:phosphoenolpyruvate carboxylase
VCIDAKDEVQLCLNHFGAERIRQDEEGRQQYLLEQAKLQEKYAKDME